MRILTITALIFLISIHCRVLAHPTGSDLILGDDDFKAGYIDSNDNSLVKRQDTIDLLPLPPDCKKMFKEAIPIAEKAYKWIVDKACNEYNCRIETREAYAKYGDSLVKNEIIMNTIVKTLKVNGVDFARHGINVGQIYDGIVNDCIKRDKNIWGIKDICASRKEAFNSIKGCILPKLMPYLPQAIGLEKQTCQVVLKTNLVKTVLILLPPLSLHFLPSFLSLSLSLLYQLQLSLMSQPS